MTVNSFEKYTLLFSGAKTEKAVGEVCPSYFYEINTPKNIKNTLGAIRIIIMLRDPSDRAFSQFSYCRMLGYEPEKLFLRAVAEEPRRMKEKWGELWYYAAQSFYYEVVKRYQDHFTPEKVLVIFHEDYCRKREDTLRAIYRFLEVDEGFASSQKEAKATINFSGQPKNFIVSALYSIARKYLSNSYLSRNCPKIIKNFYRYILSKNFKKIYMKKDERKSLVNIFYSDVLLLEKLLDVKLECWRK
jgi:hypothetical protein